jgi:hypothetical protein
MRYVALLNLSTQETDNLNGGMDVSEIFQDKSEE